MFEYFELIFKKLQFLTKGAAIAVNSGYLMRSGIFNFIKKNEYLVTGQILDFGCGSKPYETLFQSSKEYIGLDLKGTGHDHKDSKVDIYYNGVDVPFSDGYFDSIIAIEVFEHLPNVDQILDELYRILKPGGTILITVPFMYPEHEMPTDYSRWTSVGFFQLITSHKFENYSSTKSNTGIKAVIQNLIDYFFLTAPFINKKSAIFLRIPIIFLFNVLGLLLGSVLPKDLRYYSNLCVTANKPSDLKNLV